MKLRQLSLFEQAADESLPLPLIVAQKWGFRLRYIIEDGQYWYVIRDWIAALTGDDDPKSVWQGARRSPEMQPVLDDVRRIKLPETKGSPTQVVHDKGLYLIIINLRTAKNRLLISEIKEFLAAAGAFADLMRRDPQARAELAVTAGPEAVFDATVKRYESMGRDENWIHARLEGVVTRKQFTSALKHAVLNASKSIYSKSTEKIYSGLWQRTTAALRANLELDDKANIRDHFGEYALIYTRLAEKVATDKLRDAELVYESIAMEIVYAAAKLIRAQARATSEALGIDLVTEKPLLPDTTE